MANVHRSHWVAVAALTLSAWLAGCGGESTDSRNNDIPGPTGCTDAFEANGSTATASEALAPGTQITAKLCSSSDVDYYAVSLASPDIIDITMIPPASQDYELALYDANETLVAASSSGMAGESETISYAGGAATYFIEVLGTHNAFHVTDPYSLTAVWPPAATGLPLTLDVTRQGAGTGAVTSAPTGIDCLPICSASFPNGTATLTATPDPNGATFEGWSGACSGTGACIVTRLANMPANQAVTATFGQVYTGTLLTGSGTYTRPMTYGECTWSSTWSCSVNLLVVGWDSGSLTGTMQVTCDRSEPAGTPTDGRQTCLAGSAFYDETQPISGTPSALTWSAQPFDGSSFLDASFTGAMAGNVGTLGGDTVSGVLTITAFAPASGSGSVGIALSR